MATAINMRTFVDNYNKGVYDEPDQNTIKAIWHNRHTIEKDLQARTRPLAKKVMRFLKVALPEIDMDKMFVHFRKVTPPKGVDYDTFTITERQTSKVLYFIAPRLGHDVAKGKAHIIAMPDENHVEIMADTYGETLNTLKSVRKNEHA